MKTMATASLCLSLFLTTLATCPAEVSKRKNENQPAKPECPRVPVEERMLTGSYLKQAVRKAGRITDGASHVIVVDRQAIDRSGARDLRQLLAQHGAGW